MAERSSLWIARDADEQARCCDQEYHDIKY